MGGLIVPKIFTTLMIIVSFCFGQDYSYVGHFSMRADYGHPFSAYVFYEEASQPSNNCMIMLPNYYSYYYSNSASQQSITMRSESATLNYLDRAIATADPEFNFSAFLDNSTAYQNAKAHASLVYPKTTTTMYKNAESATIYGYPAYRVAFFSTSTTTPMHFDYLYFTKANQCFKFGYSISKSSLTQAKEDSILTFVTNAIVFLSSSSNLAKTSNNIEQKLPRITQVADQLLIQDITDIKLFNALGKQLKTVQKETSQKAVNIPIKARGLYLVTGKSNLRPITESTVVK